MADVSAIREALAANASSITGLQQSAYMLASPTPPSLEVLPAEIEYDLTASRGLDKLVFTVRVMVGNTSDIAAQKLLDEFLDGSGAKSIKAQLQTDRDLGGACDALRVTKCSGYRVYGREGGAPALGAEWTVEVYAKGET